MAKTLDAEIDKLYQLPLDEFTAARNALAKEAGKDGASIRDLAKPAVAAWAVNQLYWGRRDTYDALVAAAEELRGTHKAVIEGRKGDLRGAGREHEHALDRAFKATLGLLKDGGHPVTDSTRQAILNTLRALPADEAAGRLTRPLAPGGFELLAGVTPAKGTKKKGTKPTKSAKRSKSDAPAKGGESRKAAREKADREAAERAVREADGRARRAEFEAARAAREAVRAEKLVAEAHAAVERARGELAEAERAATAAEREAAAANRARDAAERKARDAESALEAARARIQP